jgi:hypothetical protein
MEDRGQGAVVDRESAVNFFNVRTAFALKKSSLSLQLCYA